MPQKPAQKPWSEAQWEAFMKRSEARAARFGELLETVGDHPDRDAILNREMGWSTEDRRGGTLLEDHDEAIDAEAESFEPAAPPAVDEVRDAAQRRGDLDRDVPAYGLAHAWGLRVHDALRPYLRAHDGGDDDVAEQLGAAFIHSLIPAAKIAGGHAMGYEDDALCGNIVCNRFALRSTEQALDALRWLRDEGVLPLEVAGTLLDGMTAVHHALTDRIAELRALVWW